MTNLWSELSWLLIIRLIGWIVDLAPLDKSGDSLIVFLHAWLEQEAKRMGRELP